MIRDIEGLSSIYINTYTKKRKKNLNTDVIFLKFNRQESLYCMYMLSAIYVGKFHANSINKFIHKPIQILYICMASEIICLASFNLINSSVLTFLKSSIYFL